MVSAVMTHECVNPLAPGRFESNFRCVIFKLILVIDGCCFLCQIALRWMSEDLTDDKSTLVQVMACCRQATSLYLSQCWPRSMSRYGITRWQCVNLSVMKLSYLEGTMSVSWCSGAWFNIKMSFQYRKSHCGDKTILWPSYPHNGISYTGKTTSLYWIGSPGSLQYQVISNHDTDYARMNKSLSSMRNDFKYLHHFSFEKW